MSRIRDILSLPAPKEIASTISDIDYERLFRLGFRFLFFDYDNTLAPWRTLQVGAATTTLFQSLMEKGFSIFIITNAAKNRAEKILQVFEGKIPVYGNMRKPSTKKLKKIFEQYPATAESSVLIGDLFVTDVVAGNRAKLYTIMVNPYTAGLKNAFQFFTSFIPIFFYKLYFYTIGWFFRMTHLISPNEYEKDIFAIDYEKLDSHEFDTLIFDLDNTLTTWRQDYLDAPTEKLLRKLQADGFTVLIFSNTFLKERIQKLQHQLGEGFTIQGKMRKPLAYKMKEWLKKSGKSPHHTVIIGDQLFTDILCGNILHLYTIKVEPLDLQHEFWITKVLRWLERKIINFMHIKPKV